MANTASTASTASTATFSIWRGDRNSAGFRDYRVEVSEGMVVLDAVHRIQAEQAHDLACRWNCKAGKCDRAPRRSTASRA
jgi:succinate dehydrogenase / fumarate reductase, iron-sulfur subunit